MKRLDRHLLRRGVMAYLGVQGVLLTLFVVSGLGSLMHSLSFLDLEELISLSLPLLVEPALAWTVPISIGLAALILGASLWSEKAILAPLSAGISLHRLNRPMYFFGFMLSVLYLILFAVKMPESTKRGKELAERLKVRGRRLLFVDPRAKSVRLPDGRILCYEEALNDCGRPDRWIFRRLWIVKIDDAGGDLDLVVHARQAVLGLDDLELRDGAIWTSSWGTRRGIFFERHRIALPCLLPDGKKRKSDLSMERQGATSLLARLGRVWGPARKRVLEELNFRAAFAVAPFVLTIGVLNLTLALQLRGSRWALVSGGAILVFHQACLIFGRLGAWPWSLGAIWGPAILIVTLGWWMGRQV